MSWVDDDEAKEFFDHLKARRKNALELLIGVAENSTDTRVTKAWGSYQELVRVLKEMEDERGKHSDE